MKTTAREMLGLIVVAAVAPSAAGSIQKTAGVDDNFAGGPDPANPSAQLAALVGQTTPFDTTTGDNNTAHTFVDLPPNITGATLEFRVRGLQLGAGSDGLILSFVDPQTVTWVDAISWARTFGTFGGGGTIFSDPDPGFLTPGGSWNIGQTAFGTLDLAALPLADGTTLNVIPTLNARGFIDVTGGDDSALDFFRLTIETCGADLAPPFGMLDFFDVLAFLELFDAQDPAADLAPPSAVWNSADVSAFLSAFDQGCPEARGKVNEHQAPSSKDHGPMAVDQ